MYICSLAMIDLLHKNVHSSMFVSCPPPLSASSYLVDGSCFWPAAPWPSVMLILALIVIIGRRHPRQPLHLNVQLPPLQHPPPRPSQDWGDHVCQRDLEVRFHRHRIGSLSRYSPGRSRCRESFSSWWEASYWPACSLVVLALLQTLGDISPYVFWDVVQIKKKNSPFYKWKQYKIH